MLKNASVTGAVLLACVGSAVAVPVVDGVRDAEYGAAKWVNTTNPTGFGNSSGVTPCVPSPGAPPENVTTGYELVINLASVGSPTGAIRVLAMITSGNQSLVSNQTLPSLPAGSDNLGDPRDVDFSTIAGTQFATVGATAVSTTITVDGTRDDAYGAPVALQVNATSFGNATTGSTVGASSGSELNALYALRNDNGTPADPTDDRLHLFFAGNVLSNFGNKFTILLDTRDGGQPRLISGPFGADLGRLGGDAGGTNGMRFDAGFEPDFALAINGEPNNFYTDSAELIAGGGGAGGYQGRITPGGSPTLDGGSGSILPQAQLNNSNTAGVGSFCSAAQPVVRDVANGSEINAVYSFIDVPNNRLYVLVTGNLETGGGQATENTGNKLNLFFDVQPGGQNRMLDINPDISFNNLNRFSGNDNSPATGMRFEAGFEADYWLQYKNVGPSNNVSHVVDAAVLRTNGSRRFEFDGQIFGSLDYGAYYGGPKNAAGNTYRPASFMGDSAVWASGAQQPNQTDGSTTNIYSGFSPRLAGDQLVAGQTPPFDEPPSTATGVPGGIIFDADNSNTGGVSGNSVAGAADVTTGIEFSFRLDELGWDGVSDIKLTGIIGNNDATFMSNQVIGGLPASFGNLANPTTIDFQAYEGQQFVTLFPTGPTACNVADIVSIGGFPPADGELTVDDYTSFINAFAGDELLADIVSIGGFPPADGELTVDDYTSFINAFAEGC